MKITIFPSDPKSFFGAIDEKLTNTNREQLDEMRQWCGDNGIMGGWSCTHDLRVCFSDEEQMELFLLRWV